MRDEPHIKDIWPVLLFLLVVGWALGTAFGLYLATLIGT